MALCAFPKKHSSPLIKLQEYWALETVTKCYNEKWFYFKTAFTSNGSRVSYPEKYSSFEFFLSKNKAVSQAHCCGWALWLTQ